MSQMMGNSDEMISTPSADIKPDVDKKTNGNFDSTETERCERLTRLPIARVRTLIKADQDVTIASQESVFLITKATELFIESLAKEMHRITQGQKRKTVYRKDMDSVVEMMDEYAFLEGALD